jgi:hypothetical protein
MPQQTCASHIPDVIHEFQEPQNKEMAKIVEEARAMQAAKVSFELHPEGDRGDTRAVFNLPKTVSQNSLTETFTVCARGGQFEMTVFFHVCNHPVCFYVCVFVVRLTKPTLPCPPRSIPRSRTRQRKQLLTAFSSGCWTRTRQVQRRAASRKAPCSFLPK